MVMPAPVEQEELKPIQGIMPDSKEENWVAEALYKYDIRFRYQWQLFGGTTRRGGLVVDFVVWNPRMTPVLVYGRYWHKNELPGGDRIRITMIASHFKVPEEQIPVLWADHSITKEDVFEWVRKEILG